MRFCKNCRKFLKIINFYPRSDRPGFHAFCKMCMDEQGRSLDHPDERDRGSGKIW
ncbi:MAG: hypothetical protein ACFFG0_22925 [Candidatus Thorarchaeota archaeon]